MTSMKQKTNWALKRNSRARHWKDVQQTTSEPSHHFALKNVDEGDNILLHEICFTEIWHIIS